MITQNGFRWGAFLGLAIACPAAGADFNLKLNVDDIELGKSVIGPSLSSADLKRQVVLLEFWGIN
jgi:hypothetical protein